MTDEKKPPQEGGGGKTQAMNIDKETLDYVEAQVSRLTSFRLESMELLNKRTHTLITLQLGAGGGLAAFAVNLLGKPVERWIVVGVVIAAALLFLLAVAGVLLCMFTESMYPPGNEPEILMRQVSVRNDLLALRAAEIMSVQARQAQWAERNHRVGGALNFLYFFTAIVPFAATGLALLAR
jgi:hypothetical protein